MKNSRLDDIIEMAIHKFKKAEVSDEYYNIVINHTGTSVQFIFVDEEILVLSPDAAVKLKELLNEMIN